MDKFLIKLKNNSGSKCLKNDRIVVSDIDPCTSNQNETCYNSASEKKLKTSTKAKRRFNPEWNKSFPWIIYDKVRDVILCSACKKIFEDTNFQFSTKKEMTFIETGFSNWKKGVEKLKIHEQSGCHKEANMKMNSLKAQINIYAQLLDAKQKQMITNRTCLLKLFSSLLYLSTQNLAIRGHTDKESNYITLLKLRSEDSAELEMWLKRESYSWCSHDIQNEMLDLISHTLLRKLIAEVKNAIYFAIICDETADISRKEQFSFCIRFVTDALEIEELFFGFYQTDSSTSSQLFNIICDILVRFDLPITNCRGQCFDGASTMSGLYNGVKAKILNIENKAFYVHCLAHTLNLVVQDTIKYIPECRDVLNMAKEIIAFVRDSPKRLVFFQSLKSDESPHLRPLCPTRWTVRYTSLSSILLNYAALVEFFMSISDNDSTESGYKAAGFLRQMTSFDFYFTLSILVKLFGQIDSVNSSLQKKSLHLEQSHRILMTLKSSIQFYRENFQKMWNEINENKPGEVDPPKLPRKRKIPKKYDDSQNNLTEAFDSMEQRYRRLFYEIIDKTLNCLISRFDTESFKFLIETERFLLGNENNEHNQKILEFYKNDIDADRLLLQREMLHQILQNEGKTVENLEDIINYFKREDHLKELLSEFIKFVKIVMTIPISTSTAERSFSGLKRLKTYLRSTMQQKRLNSLSLLHFHKEATKELDLEQIADEFISRNEQRKRTFFQKTYL